MNDLDKKVLAFVSDCQRRYTEFMKERFPTVARATFTTYEVDEDVYVVRKIPGGESWMHCIIDRLGHIRHPYTGRRIGINIHDANVHIGPFGPSGGPNGPKR